jgi:hypothetical protein
LSSGIVQLFEEGADAALQLGISIASDERKRFFERLLVKSSEGNVAVL